MEQAVKGSKKMAWKKSHVSEAIVVLPFKKEIQTQGDLVLGGANKLNSQGRKLHT